MAIRHIRILGIIGRTTILGHIPRTITRVPHITGTTGIEFTVATAIIITTTTTKLT